MTPPKQVLEIEVAADGDHSTHEQTITVFLVGDRSNLRDELLTAARMVNDRFPDFLGANGSASLSGTESLETAEWRQLIDATQDDVIVGPNVPV